MTTTSSTRTGEALLASLPEHGVGLVVNPGCTVASPDGGGAGPSFSPYLRRGHPSENCGDFRPKHLTEIQALAQEDKVVAIGEIGLDYYWPENPPRACSSRCCGSSWPWPRSFSCR